MSQMILSHYAAQISFDVFTQEETKDEMEGKNNLK